MDVKLRILIDLSSLYSLVCFTEFLNKQYIFTNVFAQLKWSGRIYTLTAVSGLNNLYPYLIGYCLRCWSHRKLSMSYCFAHGRPIIQLIPSFPIGVIVLGRILCM